MSEVTSGSYRNKVNLAPLHRNSESQKPATVTYENCWWEVHSTSWVPSVPIPIFGDGAANLPDEAVQTLRNVRWSR